MTKKRKFLTVDDYGAGGIWIYVFAREEKEIRTKYPKLSTVHQRPDWLDAYEHAGNSIISIDIDDDVPEKLSYLSQKE